MNCMNDIMDMRRVSGISGAAAGRMADGGGTLAVPDRAEDGGDVAAPLLGRLRGWLPPGSAVGAAAASRHYPLDAQELARVAGAVPSRQAEFIAARWCAHRALERIGRPAARIDAGPLGAPQWPAGVVGSLTHESGLCLALVADAAALAGVGVDLFDRGRNVALGELVALIAIPDEIRRWRAAPDGEAYLQLLFSAKEAAVKAASNRAGRLLDLREIGVVFDGDAFRATLDGLALTGRWCRSGRYILTLAMLAADRELN